MLVRAQECVRLGLELLDADPRVRRQHAAQQRPHVRVVPRVVLGDHRPSQP